MEKDLRVVLMEIRTVVSEAMELHFGLGEAMNRIEKSLLALLSVPVEKGKLICRNCGTEKIIRNSLGENDCACGQQDMTTVKENNIVEWPKKSKTVPSIPEGHLGICGCGACRFVNDLISKNELIDQCLLAHNSIIAEKNKEIAELKKRIEDLAQDKSKMSDYIRDMADYRKAKDSEIARLRRDIQEILQEIGKPIMSYAWSNVALAEFKKILEKVVAIASRALKGE